MEVEMAKSLKRKTVKASECSTLAMVVRNEKKFDTVIHNAHRMHWVGIGWVDEGPAQYPRDSKLPVVK